MDGQQPALGWPFLVARGRRRGYTVLLAPDFLVDGGEYGFLEEVAGPARQGPPVRITSAITPAGRPVCLVWTEHRVVGADLGNGSADPVDEHSRPLWLAHGFLCAAPRVADLSAADLDLVHRAALDTYRRFLSDEDGFRVTRSAAFRIESTLAAPERVDLPPRGVVRRPAAALAAAVVVALLVLLGIHLFSPAKQPLPPPAVCATTTVTTVTLPDTDTTVPGRSLDATACGP